MKIPTVQESPESFIERVAALLDSPDTHLYFDTNVLMWVTLLGIAAREQFLDLLSSFKATAHVPVWSMNEYYRLHRDRYLEKQLNQSAGELASSIDEFAAQARKYAGQAPLDDPVVSARLDRLRNEASELKRLAQSWKYEEPARETIGWMNSISCAQGSTFEIFRDLKRIGAARYSHDVPPGYEDDHKKNRKERASNRFGDLLLWQEVLEHAFVVNASTVVLLTNDRKEDWYFSQGSPEVGLGLRRLGVKRWMPVPTPHPFLPHELRSKCSADLVLVDQLYLGGIAWHLDGKRFDRLVGAALDVPTERIKSVSSKPPSATLKENGSLNLIKAQSLLDFSFTPPTPSVTQWLSNLDNAANEAEAFIESVDEQILEAMKDGDIVVLSRTLGDMAIAAHPMATAAVTRLFELLPTLNANHAACVHLGLAVATYYDNRKPRAIPSGNWLNELASFLGQAAVRHTVKVLTARLKKEHSPALYLLNFENPRCPIEIEVDTRRDQDPAEVSMIQINGRAVLTNSPLLDQTLRGLLGANEATVEQLVEVLCSHYGVAFTMATFEDGEQRRTIPEDLYLVQIDGLDMLVEAMRDVDVALVGKADIVESVDSSLDEEELEDDEDIEIMEDDGQGVEPSAGDAGEQA